ncbi:MAG: flagellar motor switch phosphatase FliY [Defluviitaleaceae bacterium]|nr:flagellar motor switch phosphatase FliY [Defluviitaleaceae bacterium]
MGEMLSQEELDALLGNMLDDVGGSDDDAGSSLDSENNAIDEANLLSAEDQDVLGEIGNINMGTAATTLFTLLNQKVLITTPKVKLIDWGTLSSGYDRPTVGIKVGYREGLRGSNILILRDRDVKIIADLMMGGAGEVSEPIELNELDMSAIGEAMNQMVGSASTSLSSMIRKKVDIDTPQPFVLDFSAEEFLDTIGFAPDDIIACVSFRMEIGDLIDSEIMQIIPADFARELVMTLKEHMFNGGAEDTAPEPAPPPVEAPVMHSPPMAAAPPMMGHPPTEAYGYPPQQPGYPPAPGHYPPPPQPIHQNVQVAQFQPFDVGEVYQQKENMGIIMDVPLEITVELGRTHKKISEILEFSPGTVLELDKLAGEPIDILVNGKFVAKGEVVVIDENFGIRITDIISVEKRI